MALKPVHRSNAPAIAGRSGGPVHPSASDVTAVVGIPPDRPAARLREARASPGTSGQGSATASSRATFRGAFEHAAIGMVLVGLDGRWLRVNRALCALTGYPQPELLAMTFQDITHRDGPGVDLAHVARRFAGETATYEMETRFHRQDGEEIAVLLAVSLVRDAAGAPLHFVVQVQDVTARNAAEAALAAERDLLRTVMDRIPDSVYVKDTASRFLRVNHAAAAELGVSDPAEAVGKTDADFFPEAQAQSFLADERRLLASGRPLLNNPEHQREGARERWVLASKVPLTDQDGRVVGLLGINRDVTVQRRAEALARRTEERYRTLVERLPAVVYLLDPDEAQTPRYFSPRFADFFGYSPDQALASGRHWLDVVHPDDRDRTAAANRRAVESGTVFLAEYRRFRADGSWIWVRDECAPVRDEGGAIVAWQGVMVDVGHEHRLREELVVAKEAAEEASRAKTSFLSTMSHELRTPLNAIIGYAHLMLDGLDGELTPVQTADVGQIAAGADRLLALVNDVLDLARVEAGRMDVVAEPVDLAPAVERVACELRSQAAAKELAVSVAVPAGIGAVDADPLRLHQVLLNLAGNAVKFTERGGVTISAREDGAWVEISVADTGPGIAAEALPWIFDEFRQADGSTTRKHGGSGLGLTIARQLAQLQGGSVGAESEVGVGSTFTLRLPKADAAPRLGVAGGPAPVPAAVERAPAPGESFERLRLALADQLGSATADLLLRRAMKRATPRAPGLAEVVAMPSRPVCGASEPWGWPPGGPGRAALGELVDELGPLLVGLGGPAVVRQVAHRLSLDGPPLIGETQLNHWLGCA